MTVSGFNLSGQAPAWFAEHQATGLIFEITLDAFSRDEPYWSARLWAGQQSGLTADDMKELQQLAISAVKDLESQNIHMSLSDEELAD